MPDGGCVPLESLRNKTSLRCGDVALGVALHGDVTSGLVRCGKGFLTGSRK